MRETFNAHVRPNRIENTWPCSRAGAFADSKCGTAAGSRLSDDSDAGSEGEAAQPAAPAVDTRLAPKSRAASGDAADITAARLLPSELATRKPEHGRQLGAGVRSRARLPKALQGQGLAALSLEHACSRAPSPYGEEKALRVAQPAASSCLPRSNRKALIEQKNCRPAIAPDRQEISADGYKVDCSPARVNAGAVISTASEDGESAKWIAV